MAKRLKALKDENRWQLWLFLAANFLVFYAVLQSPAIASLGLKGLIAAAPNLLPVGLAIIVTTVANGIMSADFKARLVFGRWTHALPGHRAFSEHALSDPRIDMAKLKRACGNKLPSEPEDQNRTWYRLYKQVESNPAV